MVFTLLGLDSEEVDLGIECCCCSFILGVFIEIEVLLSFLESFRFLVCLFGELCFRPPSGDLVPLLIFVSLLECWFYEPMVAADFRTDFVVVYVLLRGEELMVEDM